MEKIKVLIVDDSAFMRKLIQDLLSNHPRIQVIATARNGQDALKKIVDFKPDVITMDVEMPILNGLDALKQIMEKSPLPVIMLSSTTKAGADNTVIAMQNGAFDFIQKPSGAISLDLHKIQSELIEKIILASKSDIAKLSMSLIHQKLSIPVIEDYSKIDSKKVLQKSPATSWPKKIQKLVLIGTSTGGPRALQTVLSKLPSEIDAPLLIVQHMPAGFTKSLAARLDTLSAINVKEAEDGEVLLKGTAYIAPGGFHLTVKAVGQKLMAQLNQLPPRNGHRPSVDVLFDSAASIDHYAKVAVIMTGMGADGSQGLIDLKKDGYTAAIAESKESSIVFGMPKAAISTKLIDEVQDLNDIANTIMKYV